MSPEAYLAAFMIGGVLGLALFGAIENFFRNRTHRVEVMNPPRSPALGREAGNLILTHGKGADRARSHGTRGVRRAGGLHR